MIISVRLLLTLPLIELEIFPWYTNPLSNAPLISFVNLDEKLAESVCNASTLASSAVIRVEKLALSAFNAVTLVEKLPLSTLRPAILAVACVERNAKELLSAVNAPLISVAI